MRTASMLTLLVLLGLVAGAFFGQYVLFDPIAPIDSGHWTYVAGDLALIRPLMLLGVPLILAATISAVAKIDHGPRFGLALAGTLVYFAITMNLAAVLGAGAATFFRPGDLPQDVRDRLIVSAASTFDAHAEVSGPVRAAIDAGQDNLTVAWMNVLRRALPTSLIDEISRGRLLGMIVLAMLIGLAIGMSGERARPAAAFFDALADALLRIARWIAWISPVGVFLLVANAVGTVGMRELTEVLRQYVVVTAGALAAHMLIVLPLVMLVSVGRNPYAHFWRCGRALVVAFATASSMAALPIAFESALARPLLSRGLASKANGHASPDRLGGPACSRAASGLVLPLGVTINLNGTALFQAAAVVFLCQISGLNLTIGELVVVVITATLAAVTTAGVPSAGLVSMILVISAVNTTRGGEPLPATAIGILIAVDRLLDMCRTSVNIWGNLVGAKIISSIAPDEKE